MQHDDDRERENARLKTKGPWVIDEHVPMPTLTLTPQPINLVFSDDDGKEIGKFEYDKEAKRWTFEGEANESAKVFAKFMFAHFQSLIEGDRDGLGGS